MLGNNEEWRSGKLVWPNGTEMELEVELNTKLNEPRELRRAWLIAPRPRKGATKPRFCPTDGQEKLKVEVVENPLGHTDKVALKLSYT
ncbi:hypothetical protein [Sedimentitalea arenosa]|uniref:Uncharacterized protein n=1 Tax=Sedimentitalea arenosa TaxID=2798803 RepID=A0A8J7IJ76_9RHOB|nr:hypothetical protein [Arenibacterium arenosum]MBJ6370308.1 hypothetical protein [Arenibacterium arenosum]